MEVDKMLTSDVNVFHGISKDFMKFHPPNFKWILVLAVLELGDLNKNNSNFQITGKF